MPGGGPRANAARVRVLVARLSLLDHPAVGAPATPLSPLFSPCYATAELLSPPLGLWIECERTHALREPRRNVAKAAGGFG